MSIFPMLQTRDRLLKNESVLALEEQNERRLL